MCVLIFLGAGYQKKTNEASYKKLCLKACKKVSFCLDVCQVS